MSEGQTLVDSTTGKRYVVGEPTPKKTTLNIEIDRSPEIESMRKEYEEKLAQKDGLLSQVAHEEFAKEKEEFLDTLPSKLRTDVSATIGDDPKTLELAKSVFLGHFDNTPNPQNPPPAGKSSVSIPYEMGSSASKNRGSLLNRVFSSPQEMISEIWKIAANPSFENHREAKIIQERLERKFEEQMRQGKFPKFNLSGPCPACGFGPINNDTNVCLNCGVNVTNYEKQLYGA